MTDADALRLVACPAALRDAAAAVVGERLGDPPTVAGAELADLLPVDLHPGRTWPQGDDLVGLLLGGRLVVLGEEVIGGCGPIGVPDETGCLEIGYGLAPAYRGRGLGTAAVGLLVTALRAEPGVHALCADVLAANEPSWRLLERVGFARAESVRADHWHYRLG